MLILLRMELIQTVHSLEMHGSMVLASGRSEILEGSFFWPRKQVFATYPGGSIIPDQDGLTISNQNPWADGDPEVVVEITTDDLRKSSFGALESQLAGEVVTA